MIASHSGLRRSTRRFEHNPGHGPPRGIAGRGGARRIVFGGFIDPRRPTAPPTFANSRAWKSVAGAAARGDAPATMVQPFGEAWHAARPKPATTVGQVEYAARLPGKDHAGIGSDFDGALPAGLGAAEDHPDPVAALRVRHGRRGHPHGAGAGLLRAPAEAGRRASG